MDMNDRHDHDHGNAADDEAQGSSAEGGGRPSSSSHFMEGYTPLNFNMNALVMMDDSDGSDGGSRNGNDENGSSAIAHYDVDDEMEMDGNMFANGYYHMMGAPPKRLNGVKHPMVGFSMPPDHEDDGASNLNVDDGDGNANVSANDRSHGNNAGDTASADNAESVVVPDDFLLLAEQALRGLEVEHLDILERSSSVAPISDDGVVPNGIANSTFENKSEPLNATATEFDTGFASFDENQNGANVQIDKTIADDLVGASEKEGATTNYETKPASMPKIQLKGPKSSKSNPMDVDAIQKAMQSIRLKSPQLATTLDTGASSSFSTTAANVATEGALTAIIDSTSRAIIEQSKRQEELPLTSRSHSIIPAGPLAAFRRTTPKAQAASANLTRNATLSEAVLRLWPLICFRRKMRFMGLGGAKSWSPPKQEENNHHHSKTLTIHILGADGVECSSEELVLKSVGSFVRWMDAALRSGALGSEESSAGSSSSAHAQSKGAINSLLIEFSGPNMPNALLGKVLDLLSPLPNNKNAQSGSMMGLVSAKAIFQQREYHENSACDDTDVMPEADMAIAFNAGIWGYDSWKPTIAYMCSAQSEGSDSKDDITVSGVGRTLFVVTAYTVEECEDDAEVIEEVVEEVALERSSSSAHKGAIARQLWAPETNPFSSRFERKTASAPPGRKYFENGAWQAWLLGL